MEVAGEDAPLGHDRNGDCQVGLPVDLALRCVLTWCKETVASSEQPCSTGTTPSLTGFHLRNISHPVIVRHFGLL